MERDPVNPEIEYEAFLEPSPSEAYGQYRGKKFYLRARWDNWDFILSEDPDVEPDCLDLLLDCDLEVVQESEHPFPAHWVEAFNEAAFIRRGTYGEPNSWAASYMPKEERMKVIRGCIDEYDGAA